MPDRAAAFDAPVHLHARVRDFVIRPDDRLAFWDGEERVLAPGLALMRLGGHFPGGTVLHWQAAAQGGGALLVGEILQVGADRKTVSFPWSYPNWPPLSGTSVARIAARLEPVPFRRFYGAFGLHLADDANTVVSRSAARYRALLAQDQP